LETRTRLFVFAMAAEAKNREIPQTIEKTLRLIL